MPDSSNSNANNSTAVHSHEGIQAMRLSGLEPVFVDQKTLFVNVGERTNVTGSKAFARMILNGEYEQALAVARHLLSRICAVSRAGSGGRNIAVCDIEKHFICRIRGAHNCSWCPSKGHGDSSFGFIDENWTHRRCACSAERRACSPYTFTRVFLYRPDGPTRRRLLVLLA